MFLTFLATSTPGVSPAPAHDAFEWWAQIWIPALLGVATVGVSVVALWVSHRASVLASDVEAQRVRAAEERADDAARERLRTMALEEARVVHRWVAESQRAVSHSVHSILHSPPPARTPAQQARIDAEVALEQSLVPGASELLAITKLDLDWRWRFLRQDGAEGLIEHGDADEIYAERVARTFARIRAWALNPAGEAARIYVELKRAEVDPVEYLMMGHGSPLAEDENPFD